MYIGYKEVTGVYKGSTEMTRGYYNNNLVFQKLPLWVKDSMEFWYDVKKQKATNESLSANPYLVDFAHKRNPFLPVGYTELEYLKSNGTAYIDTNYIYTNYTEVSCKFKFDTDTQGCVFGGQSIENTNKFVCVMLNNDLWCAVTYNNTVKGYNIEYNKIYNIVLSRNKYLISNVGASTSSFSDINNTDVFLYLYARNTGGSTSDHSPCYIYECSIKEEDELVRNFIPCINPNGEYGMYDIVTRTFFGNANSAGSFTGKIKENTPRPVKLYNFAFSGMSGVGGYSVDFTEWRPISSCANLTFTNNRIHITEVFKTNNDIINIVQDVPSFKIKYNINRSDMVLCYRYIVDNTPHFTKYYRGQGVVSIPASINSNNLSCFFILGATGPCDITIELLPEYPNALVTDGIDDYGKMINMSPFNCKTLFCVVNVFNKSTIIIQNRNGLDVFGIGIPWYGTNEIGANRIEKSYINGILNTGNISDVSEVLNKKQIITQIGTDSANIDWTLFTNVDNIATAKCAFYSAIGFNRALTQEEINWVIDNMIDKTDIADITIPGDFNNDFNLDFDLND